jgi:hypothetical protein
MASSALAVDRGAQEAVPGIRVASCSLATAFKAAQMALVYFLQVPVAAALSTSS